MLQTGKISTASRKKRAPRVFRLLSRVLSSRTSRTYQPKVEALAQSWRLRYITANCVDWWHLTDCGRLFLAICYSWKCIMFFYFSFLSLILTIIFYIIAINFNSSLNSFQFYGPEFALWNGSFLNKYSVLHVQNSLTELFLHRPTFIITLVYVYNAIRLYFNCNISSGGSRTSKQPGHSQVTKVVRHVI